MANQFVANLSGVQPLMSHRIVLDQAAADARSFEEALEQAQRFHEVGLPAALLLQQVCVDTSE